MLLWGSHQHQASDTPSFKRWHWRPMWMYCYTVSHSANVYISNICIVWKLKTTSCGFLELWICISFRSLLCHLDVAFSHSSNSFNSPVKVQSSSWLKCCAKKHQTSSRMIWKTEKLIQKMRTLGWFIVLSAHIYSGAAFAQSYTLSPWMTLTLMHTTQKLLLQVATTYIASSVIGWFGTVDRVGGAERHGRGISPLAWVFNKRQGAPDGDFCFVFTLWLKLLFVHRFSPLNEWVWSCTVS